MDNTFNIDLKIFSLNKNHSELRSKTSDEIIDVIVNNHRNKAHAQNPTTSFNNDLDKIKDDNFTVWSYCYNEKKEKNYWKAFLPKGLGEKQNFDVYEFSYVLFLKYNDEYYCVIGGSGMTAIKKYLDNSFGIDVYQHFAKPKEDLLIDLSIRSIAGNISLLKSTYNKNTTVYDSLSYSEIPSKIKLVLRSELIRKLFKKYSLTTNRPLLEVGNYFYIKKKISYNLLKALIADIDKIRSDKTNYEELTLFRKVKELDLNIALDAELLKIVIDDVLSLSSPAGVLAGADIIEVVHPTKLEKFFECNRFSVKISKLREDKARDFYDRYNLYTDVVRYIYSNCNNSLDRFVVQEKVNKTDIRGFHNEQSLTIGRFINHLTSEIYHNGKKYFRIDATWYYLSDEYLKRLKNEAVDCYKNNLFTDDILNTWVTGDDEDTYNKSHSVLDGYFVLDKNIKENIELCDILTIKDGKIYFVHVKNGFNTSMRDLYVQVVLSAKRLWNDLNNTTEISFLKNTFDYYNSKDINKRNKIETKKVLKDIIDKKVEIVFVMAYNNGAYAGKNGWEKVLSSKSNIAQYSLVQATREMGRFTNFKFKIIDISQIQP